MAIAVKLKCSECATVREVCVKPDDKELVCPVCGRRMQNLTPQEHSEIEAIQKKQRLFCILSLVLFVIAIVCLIFWVGKPSTWASSDTRPEANMGGFIGAIICALASMVLGILGSLKRFVVEF